MSCSSLVQELKLEVKKAKEPIINCENLTENFSRVKLLFAIRSKVINSNRAVLFPIVNAKNYCESVIAVARRTLARQVDE